MSIQDQIKADLQKALKNQDSQKVSVLRMLMAALADERIALYGGQNKQLTDQQIISVIRRETKKRREAVALYRQGKRPELAEKEDKEIKILQQYLPAEIPETEITKITRKVIDQVGARGPGDFGKVMGQVMGQLQGRADGKKVAEIVKRCLHAYTPGV